LEGYHITAFDQLIHTYVGKYHTNESTEKRPKQICATVKIILPQSSEGGVANTVANAIPPNDAVNAAGHNAKQYVDE
jgi:hypothetical protein